MEINIETKMDVETKENKDNSATNIDVTSETNLMETECSELDKTPIAKCIPSDNNNELYSNCSFSLHQKDITDNLQEKPILENQDTSECNKTHKEVSQSSGQTNTDSSLLKNEGTCNTNEQNSTHDQSPLSPNTTYNESETNTGNKPNIDCRQSQNVQLYAEQAGPTLYSVKNSLVTPPIITKNLPEAFKFLPVFGMPKNSDELEQFQNAKIREYVGCDLTDEEFSKLVKFCSPDHLRTGNELVMSNRFPTQEPLADHIMSALEAPGVGDNLSIVKKLKLRVDKDTRHVYMKKLKYRGIRILPLPQNEDFKISFSPLEAGKDLIFRVRVYRPFYCNGKDRHNTRHSVFSNDMVLLGRQKLSMLRDRMVCANDVGMRVDMSQTPDVQPPASAKDLFPSGFLFINNVFYVDTREGCKDHTVLLCEWARVRGLGDFPRQDMADVTIDQLNVRLGHPEVYVHQGNCEHLFTFSEVRLLTATDPLRQSVYPFHTSISQNQTIYCTTCAEFGAKWIVTGCTRVPFDPAFFCETCFKLYLYKDGQKICDFKAFCYRGNEINLLKPV